MDAELSFIRYLERSYSLIKYVKALFLDQAPYE